MDTMKRVLAGLGSLVAVLVLVVGIPVALVAIAGNPIPDDLSVFTRPDYGGRLLIGTILPIAAWVAWLIFTIPFLLSIPSAIRDALAAREGRGIREKTGAFALQRRTAGGS